MDDTYLDAEEHFKSLSDRQRCSIRDLQFEIGKLKNEKLKQNEEIEKQTWKNREFFEENVRLSKQRNDMEEEIKTLKKQITEKEAEMRKHECSQSNKRAAEPLFDGTEKHGQKDTQETNQELGLDEEGNGVKPEDSGSPSMSFFFHQQENVINQPEEEIQEKSQKMFEILATAALEEDPVNSETIKHDNNEEEDTALSEALEVLSNMKKATSELKDRNLSLEKEKQQLEGQLKKTNVIKIKLEENLGCFETEKMMIHMQLEAAKQENHILKKSNEDESKALKEALEDLSKMKWKLEEYAKDSEETLSQKKKETLEMIDRNETLMKAKEEMEDKVTETNERKRKLEESIEGFENEKKRFKLQMEAANNEKKETLDMLSIRDEKLKEKEKVIARQKSNLKILFANIEKLKMAGQNKHH